MKSLFFLFGFFSLCSMTISDAVAPGEPIPGRDVKVGRTPPNGIFASTTTDQNGEFEFNNLPTDATAIWLEFVDKGISEKGIKAAERTIRTADLPRANYYVRTPSAPKTYRLGSTDLTLTFFPGGKVRGRLTEAGISPK